MIGKITQKSATNIITRYAYGVKPLRHTIVPCDAARSDHNMLRRSHARVDYEHVEVKYCRDRAFALQTLYEGNRAARLPAVNATHLLPELLHSRANTALWRRHASYVRSCVSTIPSGEPPAAARTGKARAGVNATALSVKYERTLSVSVRPDMRSRWR